MGTIGISGGMLIAAGAPAENGEGGAAADGSALKLVTQSYGTEAAQYRSMPSLMANVTGGDFRSTNGDAVHIYCEGGVSAVEGTTLTGTVIIGSEASMTAASGVPVKIFSKKDIALNSNTAVTDQTSVTVEGAYHFVLSEDQRSCIVQ